MLPRRPVRHQVGVGKQHTRRVGVRAENADRLAALDEQRLVVVQRFQRRDDLVETCPVARGATDAAIDDERLRVLGDFRVEVVLQHAEDGFGQPALAVQFIAARGTDDAGRVETWVLICVVHSESPVGLKNGR